MAKRRVRAKVGMGRWRVVSCILEVGGGVVSRELVWMRVWRLCSLLMGRVYVLVAMPYLWLYDVLHDPFGSQTKAAITRHHWTETFMSHMVV